MYTLGTYDPRHDPKTRSKVLKESISSWGTGPTMRSLMKTAVALKKKKRPVESTTAHEDAKWVARVYNQFSPRLKAYNRKLSRTHSAIRSKQSEKARYQEYKRKKYTPNLNIIHEN
jgi:hypothetical protein